MKKKKFTQKCVRVRVRVRIPSHLKIGDVTQKWRCDNYKLLHRDVTDLFF